MPDPEFNPYEVLHDETEPSSSGWTEDVSVDGDSLWILPNQTLPPRCVFTNTAGHAGDYALQELFWSGRSFQLKFRSERVPVYCVISEPIRRLMRIRRFIHVMPAIIIPAILFAGGSFVWFVSSLLAFLLAEVGWHLWARSHGYADLKVTNKRDGYFQVKGLTQGFLESLATELKARRKADPSNQSATLAEEPLE